MKKALTGEGSRGGHVIGHTPSGRPIYERKLDRAALEHTLAHGHFSIISAGKNPAHPEEKDLPADHEMFRQRHEQLRADLEKHGFSYTEVEGHYGGRERSFIVHHEGAPKKDANKAFLVHHEDVSEHEIIRRLGQKYRQESVIHSKAGKHELHYTTGPDAGKHHKGEGHVFVPTAPDYYTKVEHPGGAMSKFTLNFDWDKKHSFDEALHKAGYIMDLINANLDLLRKSGVLVEDHDLEKHARPAEERLAVARKVAVDATKEETGASRSMMADNLTHAEVVIASHHDRVAGRAPPSGLYDALGAGVVVADTRERPRLRAPVPTMVDLSKGADDIRAPLAYRKPVPATDPIDLAKSAVREALLEGYRLHLTALEAQNPVAQRIAKSAASIPGSRPSVAPGLLRTVAGAPVDETAVVDYAAGALKVAAKRSPQLRDGLSRLGVSRRTLTATLAAMQLTPMRVLAGF